MPKYVHINEKGRNDTPILWVKNSSHLKTILLSVCNTALYPPDSPPFQKKVRCFQLFFRSVRDCLIITGYVPGQKQ